MKAIAVLIAIAMVTSSAMAACEHLRDPWHYRGIYLGAKMTRVDIMKQLGVTQFKDNPDINAWKGCDKNGKGNCPFNRYGFGAGEWIDDQIGPYCQVSGEVEPDGFSCLNPWMNLTREGRHGINEVEVFAGRDGTVRAIDIIFASDFYQDVFALAHRQFDGAGTWKDDSQCSGPMVITGQSSPTRAKPSIKPILVDRVCEYLDTKHHSVYVTNYDQVFAHVTPPIYRGILEMKVLSQEL